MTGGDKIYGSAHLYGRSSVAGRMHANDYCSPSGKIVEYEAAFSGDALSVYSRKQIESYDYRRGPVFLNCHFKNLMSLGCRAQDVSAVHLWAPDFQVATGPYSLLEALERRYISKRNKRGTTLPSKGQR